ncbi:MAG TPA: aryl-sulfate sulfotransferase [Dehalococcoidia bacterium]|nr:aryl-sulfate sulfotransferase [Dehalococcoidia bacterium]
MSSIEPNTLKRRGVGFRGYDAARVSRGFTLFAPINETNRTIYLVDIEGQVVHTWEMPEPPGLYGYLTERGTLVCMGSVPNDSFIGRSRFHGGVVREVDWDGHVLWEIHQPDQHHDARRLRNGNVLLLCAARLPDSVAARVRGGRPGSEQEGGHMDADYLQELTTDGKVVWEWRSWEHLDPAENVITGVQDAREEWTHGNSISEMRDGNILISFRNISTIAMIDRNSGNIYWKLGAPPLAGQHAPHILASGNILLFDNGPHRLDETFPYSRVLEIDPATKQIVWQYADTPPWKFFSPRISNAQRLPNGNTLICEGSFGRIFEVTSEGETVWEYVNPHFGGTGDPATQINNVFRAYRYTAEEISRAETTGS